MKLLFTMQKLIGILLLSVMANAAGLVISSGETVLTGGTYTYDYVSITGGALKLVGDVNIICNGGGTAYFSFTGGTIYSEVRSSEYDYPSCGSGTTGANGANFAGGHPTCDGGTGGTGPDCKSRDANDGFNLNIYVNRDITILGTINLSGSNGYHHGGIGGTGGIGGKGGDMARTNSSADEAGYGGIGGKGANSIGGTGGKGGSIHLETHGGKINGGTSSQHGTIILKGGTGGKGGNGGTGGTGGAGGNLTFGIGYASLPGLGGTGGKGGNSVGGNGGKGGNITFKALQIIADYLSIDQTGGTGGSYTQGGTGGAGGVSGLYPGSAGQRRTPNGSSGANGSVANGSAGASGAFSATLIIEPTTCQEVIAAGLLTPGDVNGDCYVNISDVVMLAETWIRCNKPDDEDCEKNWRDIY